MRKLFFLCAIFSVFMIANTANAISLSPTKITETVVPGQELTGTITLGNTETGPKVLNIEVKDYYINEGRGKVYVDTPMARGMKDWITFDNYSLERDPGTPALFNYTIKIPEDAKPGGYTTAILAYATETEITTSGVGIQSRAAAFVNINIEGDYKEELALEEFGINKAQFLQGNIVFFAKIKNLGDANESPTGTISIYDENGNQVKGAYAVVKEAYGQNIVAERQDNLPVNPTLGILVYPEEDKTLNVPWENREIDTGKYTAKINLYYGKNSDKKLEGSVDFEIVDNFTISELTADKYFNFSLPVNFTGKIQNTGTTPLTPNGRFVIKNIFGSEKHRVEFTPEELAILSGEEKELNNVQWDEGFAFGYYNATLSIEVLGKTYNKSIGIWVLGWWQILISVLLIALLVFVTTRLVKNYSAMKSKLKNLQKKE